MNQVAGTRHESVIRESIEKYCSLPVLGAIPRFRAGDFPERHMGLTPYQEHHDTVKAISFVQSIAEKYLNIDKILEIARSAETLDYETGDRGQESGDMVRIGVFKDSAFQFYYPENFEELERNGAEIIEINALEDTCLPDINALYIGGGFPETNAIRLAENKHFRDSVRMAAEKGLPVYAECGGLMFLGDAIVVDKKKYPMTGIFPIIFEMKRKPQAHGYTVVEVEHPNPFYPVGTILHGHEFHYSEVVNLLEKENIYTAFKMKRGEGIKDGIDGICYKNVLGTYTHVHAFGSPEWTAGLIKRAKEFKSGHRQKVRKI